MKNNGLNENLKITHTSDVFSRFLFVFGGGCISICPVAAESELLV